MQNGKTNETPRLAIFVDCGWLFANRRDCFGIETYDMAGLFDVLTRRIVPDAVCAGAPLCVVPTAFEKAVSGHMKNAGFSIESRSTAKGQDDDVIRQEIKKLDPKSTTHILLVSGDGGYYPFLEAKKQEGIEIIVAATVQLNRKRQKTVASSYLDANGPFRFVDLYEFREKIAYKYSRVASRQQTDTQADDNLSSTPVRRICEFIFIFPPEEYDAVAKFMARAQATVCTDSRIAIKTELARTERNQQFLVAKITLEIPDNAHKAVQSLFLTYANIISAHPVIRYRSEIN